VTEPETRPLRIAIAAGLASGGTARHVIALATGCRSAGMAVCVLAPDPTLALLSEDTAGNDTAIETFAVRIGEGPRPASDVREVARLRRRLGSWRPDVVHAHGVRAGAFTVLAMTGWATGALATGGRHRPPALVVTVHNAPPASRQGRLVYGLLERICARRAQLVLCASADLAARMRAAGAAEVQQFDVPAPAMAQPSDAELAGARDDIAAGGRPVVLAVGRLAEQKGLDVLIEAAGRWRDRDPQPRTVIAGDGPLAAALRAQASRVQADALLLGPRTDVPALLAIADVVVVPSRWEARALILQEAMRAGKPIVATRVGGTPELVGSANQYGESAVLIPPEDPAALAAAVTAVLDDDRLAARLRLAARTRSDSFATEKEVINYAMSIYKRLAASRS
jgi:glycosyltransferase involved in cell wall biosynthesis